MCGFGRPFAAFGASCVIAVVVCSASSAASGLQGLGVVSVTAVKPYSPTYFVITEFRSGKTVRSASVAGFKVIVRNGSASQLSRIKVTLVIDKPLFAPLVKTATLAAIGPKSTATVSFPRFVGAEFAETTNVKIALGSERGKTYALSVPWA
jgi:hypothetical protein